MSIDGLDGKVRCEDLQEVCDSQGKRVQAADRVVEVLQRRPARRVRLCLFPRSMTLNICVRGPNKITDCKGCCADIEPIKCFVNIDSGLGGLVELRVIG